MTHDPESRLLEMIEEYWGTTKAIAGETDKFPEARVVEDGECPVCHGEKVVIIKRPCFRCCGERE